MEKSDYYSPPPYEQPPPNRPAPNWQMKLPPGMGPPTSSSLRRARPITYTVSLTCPSIRAWVRPEIHDWIIAAHRAFDPGAPSSSIRIITHQLHHDCGSGLYVGDSNKNMLSLRYMRIVVDLPLEGEVGLTAERKQELMRRIVESVQNYEGKKARETEINVVVREIREEDELWIRGAV